MDDNYSNMKPDEVPAYIGIYLQGKKVCSDKHVKIHELLTRNKWFTTQVYPLVLETGIKDFKRPVNGKTSPAAKMQGALGILFSCFIVLCASQGPQCNRPNEKLECVSLCPPEKTCRNRGIFFSCFNENTKICQMKCVCAAGYIKNDNGECIPQDKCGDITVPRKKRTPVEKSPRYGIPEKKCLRPNEFYDCGPECDNVCSNLHLQNRTNCPIKNIVCNQKCYCRDGFARDGKGNCVSVEKCNNPALREKRATQGRCTGPNEEFVSCKRVCPPQLCISIIAFYQCKPNPPCEAGCACKPGYLRESENSPCIRSCECPQRKSC